MKILKIAILFVIVSTTILSCKKEDDENPPACEAAAGLSATSITESTATLNWTSASGSSSYNIRYRITGTSAWTTLSASSNSKNITGLTAGAHYEFQVQTVCSASASSSFSSSATFYTITPLPKLIFKFHFDSTQVRLNNFGQPAAMVAGHAGQSPRFNVMSSHYVELAQDSLTPLGFGDILYHAPETTLGGTTAIDFDSSVAVGEGQTFLTVPLSEITAGTYRWLRVSLAYQNYDIDYRFYPIGNPVDNSGTIAAFIGFNTYIRSFYVNDSLVTVNANKLQGFWAFETSYIGWGITSQGQAPPGATTVPNPLAFTSPVPEGSCVVTGAFPSPLVITGNETHDIIIMVSLSTNKSFEWIDPNANGIFEPLNGDTVVDMGVRGLIPIVQ